MHKLCTHGRMNYPHPEMMSPIDRRYYKYNFQSNMTPQDYINWLYLFVGEEDDIPYIHMKNLNKLKEGMEINVIPKNRESIIKNAGEYYKKMYGGDMREEFNKSIDLAAYNYNQYPSKN